mmetsp:Transcript_6875/g.13439  ORF Transcript_6875/g.13439 Transcript_6875/m.13439 type:complete len:119 (+) Transcript_6875:291-647(+)
MRVASSTSFMSEVASSSSNRDPIKLLCIASGDAMGFSLLSTAWAMDLVSKTLLHSDGESISACGRIGEGLNSSSFAVTTVESFEGNRASSPVESPVTYTTLKKKTNDGRKRDLEGNEM